MATKNIRIKVRSVNAIDVNNIDSALPRELAVDENGKIYIGTESGTLQEIIAALPQAELDLKADKIYVDEQDDIIKELILESDEDRHSTSFIPDFVPDKEYEKDSTVVIEDNGLLLIYRAKYDISQSVFDKQEWEFLGSRDGNICGGKAHSTYTLDQVIASGKAGD